MICIKEPENVPIFSSRNSTYKVKMGLMEGWNMLANIVMAVSFSFLFCSFLFFPFIFFSFKDCVFYILCVETTLCMCNIK